MTDESHPSRGAWIEMTTATTSSTTWTWSHPSRGAWIEIYSRIPRPPRPCGRTPHGVRGLKFVLAFGLGGDGESHPSRGAWIEIVPADVFPHPLEGRTPHGVRGLKFQGRENRPVCGGSHPSRGAWIEMRTRGGMRTTPKSHPSRGAWIEICPGKGTTSALVRRTPHGVRGLK